VNEPPSPFTFDAAEPLEPCPVAKEQLPLEEYKQLERSWFFRWPAEGTGALYRALGVAWLLTLPLGLMVASGSWSLRHHPPQLAAAACTFTLVLPLLLLLRQWLGWSHLNRRLCAERVEYEESGWYDGQVWEKPLAWRQRDLLVARHQVGPVLQRLRRAFLWTLLLMGVGTGLCQAL
jgi:disulfide bond formation protein DsbB